MIIRLAFRNVIGQGKRSIINISIIALVLIGIIWMQGMLAGWLRMAEKQSREWKNGDGRFTQYKYDSLDPFIWDESYAEIPHKLQPLIDSGNAVPVLILAGTIYPDGRLFPLVIKGIPANQTVLKLPTAVLADSSDFLPALIGARMAKSAHLNLDDIVTMRWRDVHGAYNAADIRIAKIMDTPQMEVDNDQVWVDLARLQQMKDTPGSATFIILSSSDGITTDAKEWKFESIDDLLIDLRNVVKTESAGAYFMYAIMVFMAMIAIFDTQALAVFKRKREIGTFAALGMTQSEIIRMFVMEGVMYSLLASVLATVLGMPLYIYFGTKGWVLPGSYENLGISGLGEAIIFHYSPLMILSTFVVIILTTAFVSWLPAAKIARFKPSEALSGKAR